MSRRLITRFESITGHLIKNNQKKTLKKNKKKKFTIMDDFSNFDFSNF